VSLCVFFRAPASSAASIPGGMQQGLSIHAAAEFSFSSCSHYYDGGYLLFCLGSQMKGYELI
jgi:hypothetical protein